MLFNEKQLKILQNASLVLIQDLGYSNEEALKLIANGISKELQKREKTMEEIVQSHRTIQIDFIQDVSRAISLEVSSQKKHTPVEIANAIEKFRGILDAIWSFD